MDPSKTKEEKEEEEEEERVPMFSGRPTPMPIPQPMPKPVKTWPTFNVTGFSIDWLKTDWGFWVLMQVEWTDLKQLTFFTDCNLFHQNQNSRYPWPFRFPKRSLEPPFHVHSLSASVVVDGKRAKRNFWKGPMFWFNITKKVHWIDGEKRLRIPWCWYMDPDANKD